jgi:hypothetical protein
MRQTEIQSPVEPPTEQSDILHQRIQEAIRREIERNSPVAALARDPYRRRR